ncbi:MAG: single-stranded-DNA-specific exonuclease RecJ [Clostridia bacterium]|nr:single-stranded-DNA-specific exonuclease RecJ [Clostridia bacterium]
MLGENWFVSETDKRKEESLSVSLGISRLTARVLVARGYDTPDSARGFLSKSDLCLHDPMLLKDMDKACERIKKAIDENQSVCIYGDYDVDGVTSTTALYLYLTGRGARCRCFIPERLSEGYGLNKAAIGDIARDTDLIITVDTGITARDEIEYARSLGVDVIVTDHHNCREELPDACAVVNPRREDCDYPFKALAGVGVVFKLLCALEGDSEKIFEEYADIVAIGTVADVMPITDENRLIVDKGLKQLADTRRVGLRALMDCTGVGESNGKKKVFTSTVGYVLAPRLNAAGRIASARKSLDLLLETDYEKAKAMATELCEINVCRQTTEQRIYKEATQMIGAFRGDRYSYILHSDNWHQGVVGVVASKISERYSLPAILFSFDGDIGKGSGRSVKGLNLTDLLAECSDLLIEYGGHELAAGLSIERRNLDAFIERFEKLSREKLEHIDTIQPLNIDCELYFDEITSENAAELQLLEPFGLTNAVPQFIVRGVTISEITPISADKNIRIKLRDRRTRREVNAVYFGMSHCEFPFVRGDECELACTLGLNEYRGVVSPQLLVRAVRPCEEESKRVKRSREIYASVCSTTDASPVPFSALPTVNDFREVFRLLKRELENERKCVSVRYLKHKLASTENADIDLCAIKIVIDVMNEFGLAETTHVRGNDIIEIKLLPYSAKIDLEKSEILRRIKKRAN